MDDFVPTELGKAIFDDEKTDLIPYLDDPATLWLIHWQDLDQYQSGNSVVLGIQHFKEKTDSHPTTFKEELYEWVQQQKASMRPVSDNTLQRDVNCFIRTYCQSRHTNAVIEETFDCPLVELNLIAELPNSDGYEFQRGEKATLPTHIFAATLVAFWDAHLPERNELPFSELMYAPSSPGRIFRLDEDTMTMYLESLNELTKGALQYDETAGLKQVYRHKDLNQMELLKRYYG